jgi:thiosulfate reductase cytochrome b subunit
VAGYELRTTGLFGLSRDADGMLRERGFPAWATVPGPRWLSMARRWHFFFAWVLVVNGAIYAAYSLWSRHVSRDLLPTRRDLRSIGRSVLDHLRFRHPRGESSRHYNVLQKLTYLIVIFGLLPFVVLMGLAMSPSVNSMWPGWVDVFGGRQSARTLHFVAAMALVLFTLIHVFQVVITGVWNNLRSMITGRYEIRHERSDEKT